MKPVGMDEHIGHERQLLGHQVKTGRQRRPVIEHRRNDPGRELELGFPRCSEDQVAVEQHHHIDGDQRTVDQLEPDDPQRGVVMQRNEHRRLSPDRAIGQAPTARRRYSWH